MITEAFLFHAWQCRLFNTINLFTLDRESLQILHPGILNTDAGPDFMNARIRIGETLWAGNVEIHIKASDWKKHFHQDDKAYTNIILHVVYEADELIKRPDGTQIPVLVLKGKIVPQAWYNYQYLLSNKQWVPCASQLQTVPSLVVDMQVERMLTERLEKKTQLILVDLKADRFNWEETFYHYLARNFGFHVNAVPFELMAKALPGNLLAKHKASPVQTEALLFGAAGLLDKDMDEDYPVKLKEEFRFLQNKFKLQSLETHLWKFLRLRPANFPTIRIAQFSSLVLKGPHTFSKVLELETVNEVVDLFSVDVSPYWRNHFTFGNLSRECNKQLGLSSIHNLIINTVVPFLFIYGNQKGLPIYRERAFAFLEQIPAEKNNLIGAWKKLHINCVNAAQSQGLIELKNSYCDHKKCLNCSIGNSILKN